MEATKTVTRQDVMDKAREYLGTPYAHQGKTHHGLDCTGLLVRVAMDLGMTFDVKAALKILKVYPRKPVEPLDLIKAFDSVGLIPNNGKQGWEPGDDPGVWGPGDMGLFWVSQSRMIRHAGFFGAMLEYPTIIHCYLDIGKVVEHSTGEFWESRIAKTYRFAEFDAWQQ